MDPANRAQRAAILEEKRRKLEELKKARSRRSDDAQQAQQRLGVGGATSAASSSASNLDEYIDGLLMTTAGPGAAASSSAAATAGGGGGVGSSDNAADGATISRSISEDGMATDDHDTEATKAAVVVAAASAPAPAAVVETFTVATQTDDDDFPEPPDRLLVDLENECDDDCDDDDDDAEHKAGRSNAKASKSSKVASIDASGGAVRPAPLDTNADDRALVDASTSTPASAPGPKVLSPDQLQREVSTPAFSSFLNAASKKVERFLGAPLLSELMVELGLDDDPARAAALQQQATLSSKDSLYRSLVSSRIVFECPRWTSSRDITEIDWSPLHREMILTTHHAPSSTAASTFASSYAPAPPPPPSQEAASNFIAAASSPVGGLSSSLVPRSSGELQSAGLACVWSLALATRPEHVFAATSPVTAGRFHPSESPLVVGGLESGQLVVWDARAGRMPVQKSALTSASTAAAAAAASTAAKCHAYPLTGMEIIEGGLGLATSSTDGRMNFWSFASLREPVESIQVGDSVSCFTVLPESGGILAADDHGGLYMIGGSSSATSTSTATGPNAAGSAPSASSSAAPSSRKQIRKLVAQDGSECGAGGPGSATGPSGEGGSSGSGGGAAGVGHHFGVVTALSAKVFKGTASAAAYSRTSTGLLRGSGGLVLSTGVDWTTKLWAPAYAIAAAQGSGGGGGSAAPSSGSGGASARQQPLMPLWSATSHSYDYMSDVKWSPVHPGLFATASSNGTLGLWNLASSLDDPLTGPEGLAMADGRSSSSDAAPQLGGEGGRGLNKVRWSGDGRRLAVAAGDVMHVLTLREEVARPKGDEDDRIMNALVSRGLVARH